MLLREDRSEEKGVEEDKIMGEWVCNDSNESFVHAWKKTWPTSNPLVWWTLKRSVYSPRRIDVPNLVRECVHGHAAISLRLRLPGFGAHRAVTQISKKVLINIGWLNIRSLYRWLESAISTHRHAAYWPPVCPDSLTPLELIREAHLALGSPCPLAAALTASPPAPPRASCAESLSGPRTHMSA
jgi:hypothetical protein